MKILSKKNQNKLYIIYIKLFKHNFNIFSINRFSLFIIMSNIRIRESGFGEKIKSKRTVKRIE
jgi:hypothetical protein